MSRPGIDYQPALDGLRALAVAVVLLFHGGIAGFSGGYLGVSVFFTLSGFLITSLLSAEHHRTGRVDVAAFYVRRAKRLLPASLLCVALIGIVRATTDWFDAVDTLRRDMLGALFQVANWVFLAGEGSYQELFDRAAGQASPLEHYWSLAIEEQFYWLWPLAFLALARVARSHERRLVVVGALTAVFALVAPLVAWRWGGDAAYWATPARASEILVGAFAAFVARSRRLDRWWPWLAPLGFGALAVAIGTFPAAGGPAYAGALPLVGVASAALIVGLQAPGPWVRVISLPPLVWLGRVSYGVYLYHWPVFVVVDQPRVDLDGAALFALRLGITLVIAQLSFVLVEQPIRRSSGWRPRHVGLTGLAASALVGVVAVLLVPAGRGDYWRDTAGAEAAAIEPAGTGDLAPLVPASSTPGAPSSSVATTVDTASTGSGPPTASTAPPPSVPPTTVPLPTLARPMRVLVAGDSTAEATGSGLVQWALERPDLAQVSIAAEPGCGFVRGGELLVQEWDAVPARCDTWLDRHLLDTVASLRPDVVMLMTTSWDVLDRRWAPGEQLTPLDAAFAERIRTGFAGVTTAVLDAGATHVVWVREPVPNVFWWSSGQTQEDPARHDVLHGVMDDLASADPARVSVVDLPGWLDEQGLATDQAARPDGVHWSPDAAARIARDFLGERLLRAALGLAS